jgi:hypothetical protein
MNYALVGFRSGLRSGGVSLLAALDIFSHFRVMPHRINPYLAVSRRYAFITGSDLSAESSVGRLDRIITVGTTKSKAMG